MNKEKLEALIDYVVNNLDYDYETGLFIRTCDVIMKHNSRTICKAGDIAGCLKDGYIYIHIKGKTYAAHKLAWLWCTGNFPADRYDIDHINRIKHDNRFENLRLATRSQNMQYAGNRITNTSGYKGVSWQKARKLWQSCICINGSTKYLGCYDTAEKAAKAYDKAALKRDPEFAYINFESSRTTFNKV